MIITNPKEIPKCRNKQKALTVWEVFIASERREESESLKQHSGNAKMFSPQTALKFSYL